MDQQYKPVGHHRKSMRSAQGIHGRPVANPREVRGRFIGDASAITVNTWEAYRITMGQLYMPTADPKATHSLVTHGPVFRSMGLPWVDH